MGRGIRNAVGTLVFLLGSVARMWADEPAQYQLTYQFPQGETLNYISQHNAHYKVTHPQAQDKAAHSSMLLRSIRVLSSASEAAQVELTINRARMTSGNADGVVVYDSQKPKEVPDAFEEIHQKINKPLLASLTPHGQVVTPSTEAAEDNQTEFFYPLPNETVAMGAKWNERYEIQVSVGPKLFKTVRMERRFELLSVESGIATIGLKTVCLSPMNDPTQEFEVLQKSPHGQFRLEIATGRLLERQLVIDDNIVNSHGPGTQAEVKSVLIDRFITADKVAQVDLTKPLIPIKVTEETAPAAK